MSIFTLKVNDEKLNVHLGVGLAWRWISLVYFVTNFERKPEEHKDVAMANTNPKQIGYLR